MAEVAPLSLIFVLLLASWLGWRMQRVLPEHYRSGDTVDAVRLVLGMLVTFSALVLGLLTTSAKSHFDADQSNLQSYSVDLISLDQRLREYGIAAEPIRALIRAYTAAALYDTWPEEKRPSGVFPEHLHHDRDDGLESKTLGTMLLQADRMIAALTPDNAIQRQLGPMLAARMQMTLQDRWVLVGSAQPTLSWPFVSVLIGWLVFVFAIFGLSAPANGAVYGVIGVAALSISMALWLIVDLDAPATGLLKVSSVPMREALMHLDLPAW